MCSGCESGAASNALVRAQAKRHGDCELESSHRRGRTWDTQACEDGRDGEQARGAEGSREHGVRANLCVRVVLRFGGSGEIERRAVR